MLIETLVLKISDYCIIIQQADELVVLAFADS